MARREKEQKRLEELETKEAIRIFEKEKKDGKLKELKFFSSFS